MYASGMTLVTSHVKKCMSYSHNVFLSIHTNICIAWIIHTLAAATQISQILVSIEEVGMKLSHLDFCKGAGPDDILPSVLRSCHEDLAPIHAMAFNLLLHKGVSLIGQNLGMLLQYTNQEPTVMS